MTEQNRLFHCKNSRSLRTTVLGQPKFYLSWPIILHVVKLSERITTFRSVPSNNCSQLLLGFEAHFYHFRSKAGIGYPKDHLLFLIMIVTVIKAITFPHKLFTLIPPWECFFLHTVGLTALDLKFSKPSIYPEQ